MGSTLPPVGVGSKSQEEPTEGGAASQGDSTLPQVTRGQTPQHREHQQLEAFFISTKATHPLGHQFDLSLFDKNKMTVEILSEPCEQSREVGGMCKIFICGGKRFV